jgi:aldehyde dehydrogenase (NAD+)
MTASPLFASLGLSASPASKGDLAVTSPIDGSLLARLETTPPAEVPALVERAHAAFQSWRRVPAPRRGELIRLLGEELRIQKSTLGELVTRECGKIREEGLGEVQEMIDICDYAVGLSRMIGGHTFPSERPDHVMHENWYPLGVVGVISAFNFPVAVWAWNFAIAIVCGNSVVWKPSEKTPLTALACQEIFARAAAKFGDAPDGLSQVALGRADVGKALVDDPRVALVSATGSVPMGRAVGEAVARRMGRCLLELGGNNAVIVTPSVDLEVALPSIVFGAVGTTGQRCTTTRRLFVHESLRDDLLGRLCKIFSDLHVRIGDPMDAQTLIGPLIDEDAFDRMQKALAEARAQGGRVHGGKRVLAEKYPEAHYVTPALVEISADAPILREETFAPILYMVAYEHLEDAIALNNAVPQGLSSAIFTTDLREAELFRQSSDCGIANVNIGTSGAEIGGAFGGEKETGGGRESGSDSWKQYMRRQTATTYYGRQAPSLAQGIRFS